jgi:hypothetical protein
MSTGSFDPTRSRESVLIRAVEGTGRADPRAGRGVSGRVLASPGRADAACEAQFAMKDKCLDPFYRVAFIWPGDPGSLPTS